MFAAQRITANASKVHYVVGALDQATIRTVGDLLGTSASYEAIRTRLTEAFATSNAAKYRELVRPGGLGDRRPSQLLRDMRGNLPPGIGEEALKEFWMQRLPSNVRVVLHSLDASLDAVAARADLIMDASNPLDVDAVSREIDTDLAGTVAALAKQVQALTQLISSPAGTQQRHSAPTDAGQLPPSRRCYYHETYGAKARKCRPPYFSSCARYNGPTPLRPPTTTATRPTQHRAPRVRPDAEAGDLPAVIQCLGEPFTLGVQEGWLISTVWRLPTAQQRHRPGPNLHNVNNTQTSKKTTKPIAIKLTNTADGWKTTQQNKRLLSSSSNSQPDSPTSPQTHKSKLFKTTNRYEVLVRNENENNSDDPGDNDISDHDAELLVKPPPPIYIKGVLDFQGLCTKLIELIGVDNFICKSTIDRLKIQTKHPESYRATIQLLKENKAEYHTYQLKEDKPLRVVIRNLHPSTKTETIKEELLFRNFDIRQVTNVLHKNSKVPLPLFFIDLEPVEKSKEIFLLQNLLHTKVKVEEPYKPKVISQCTNCQDYGHTQNYCGYPPRCVRCGANHPSAACPNSREHPPKCALCANNHPANYKGCTIYRELQQRKYSNKNNNAPVNNSRLKQSNVQVSHPLQDSSSNNSSNTKTYAQATSNVPPQNSSDSCTSDISKVMSSFLDEFKALIHPLLALLTKVISSLLDKKND
ncbi:hypothetical protein QTP88_007865 [Uroleucon formosanum]